MKEKGQGSISYLLLIGGAIIMASVALFMLYGVSESGKGYSEKGIFLFENRFKELEKVVEGCGDGVCRAGENCPEDCCQADCTFGEGYCHTACNGLNNCALTSGMPDWAKQGDNVCVSGTSYAMACEGTETDCSPLECYDAVGGAQCVNQGSGVDGTCEVWETCSGSPGDCNGFQANCSTGFRCIQMLDGNGYCLKENDKCGGGVEDGECTSGDQCGCGDCEGTTFEQTGICSPGEKCFGGNCLTVNQNCSNEVEDGVCDGLEDCSCSDCEGQQNGCQEGWACVSGSCEEIIESYTCGANGCEYGLGETPLNCPTDCCESDCTAIYDSTCYAVCDESVTPGTGCSMAYPAIMDGNVAGKSVCIDESSEAIACTGSAVACEANEKCAFGKCRKIDLDCEGGIMNGVCEATEDCSCSDCMGEQDGCGTEKMCCPTGCRPVEAGCNTGGGGGTVTLP